MCSLGIIRYKKVDALAEGWRRAGPVASMRTPSAQHACGGGGGAGSDWGT